MSDGFEAFANSRWGLGWEDQARDPFERFWAKVDTHGGDPSVCWEWTGSGSKGYGLFRVGKRNVQAPRFAYESRVGPIPEGLHIDHLCRNTICVNPAHLEPVTNRENALRGESFSAENARKTHCPQGHPYSGDNLYVCPRGKRTCRTCSNANNRRRRRAKKMRERAR